ncbi:hypothetical protein N665_0010s0006 [Sinapis alba]|nr:hypothetical protein N665_0010s0006 [Sinapis alba]
MSKAITFKLINDVKPYKNEWRIRVKLLHSWRQKTSFGRDTLECILANETGVKIAASCKKNQMNRVERGLPIGEWSSVENFTVSAASGKYRPTRHQYRLTLTGDTVLTSSDFSCDNNFLSLANYDDVANGKLNDHFLIVEAHIEDSNDQTIICLIRFAKTGSYRGEVKISNAFDASLVSINPMLEEVIHFKEKILANGLPLALIEEKEENHIFKQQKDGWNDCEVRSISEILIAIEVESCKIICSVESIDTDWGWFYFGCTDYVKIKNINEKPLFYCEKCRANVSNISPKYKLHLFVKDDSASCKVMILDSVATSIIGNTATKLWDGSYVEVWSGDMICKIESQTEPCSLTDTNSSTHSAGELYGVDPNNESSSEGFLTPFSKRKEEDANLQDKTSTSKKLCTKLIKMEKTKTY